MTPAQFAALSEYVQAVCDHMLHHVAEPHSRMKRYLAARAKLEAAFGIELPPLDLFALPEGTELVPAPKPSNLPDLL